MVCYYLYCPDTIFTRILLCCMASCSTFLPLTGMGTYTETCSLKIIVPALSHLEALQALNLRTLDERRNELCVKTLKKISRGGPLVKHLPMTSQHTRPYQTRGATK